MRSVREVEGVEEKAMQFVGSHEARTRLPELLRSVERGESTTITLRGVPIARLVGIDAGTRKETGAIIARMRRARTGRTSVSTEEILSARDEERRR